MKTNRIIIGGIVGAVSFFFLGWLVYGVLLHDFMVENYNNCSSRPMEHMVWYALILSNLFMGFLVALAIAKTNAKGIIHGTVVAAVLGFMLSAAMDFSWYSMSTMFLTSTALVLDIIISTIMWTVIGLIISLVMFMGKKSE